jgi:hypothetical protein
MFSREFILDAAERVVSTYVQVFLGLLIASGVTGWDAVTAALVAAIPAGLSALKAVIASRFGDPDTASFRSGL